MTRRSSEDPITFESVRKLAIVAMFSDDLLMDRLVLKGGNALNLVLELSVRVSTDLDFSLEGDFPDERDAAERIERALLDRFDSAGYRVFDYKFSVKGARSLERGQDWGGYEVEFKVIPKAEYNAIQDQDRRRREATVISPGQQRVFKIQISRNEYCQAKLAREVDGFTVFVYTPTAIVVEKLRALCQQMPEYLLIPEKMKRPRPRDYYDIYTVMTRDEIVLTEARNVELLWEVFAAKQVSLRLLGRLHANRAFHEVGFDAVRDTVPGDVKPFSFYADYLEKLVMTLKPFWDE